MAKKRAHLKAPVPIDDALFGKILGKKGAQLLPLYRAKKAWRDAVGDEMAAHAIPKEIRGGVLFVAVDSPAHGHHLTMIREEILKKLEEKTGRGFTALRVVSGSVASAPPTH